MKSLNYLIHQYLISPKDAFRQVSAYFSAKSLVQHQRSGPYDFR